MKKLLIGFIALTSVSAFASLSNTGYEARHITVVEKALEKNCGTFKNLELVAKSEEVIRVDQGIRDVYYTTVLTGDKRLDQNTFDTYEITIKSEYADMYDHTNKDWGVYSVTSVSCDLK